MKFKLQLFFIAFSFVSSAQVYNWQWAKSGGGIKTDVPYKMAISATGNVYVAGIFASPVFSVGGLQLTNSDNTYGTSDLFIVKYDSIGNLIWARRPVGNFNENVSGIVVDASENVIIVGAFIGSNLSFGNITVGNAGSYDMYMAKYSSAGNPLWAKSIGGTSTDMSDDVAVDLNGNIFWAGSLNTPTIVIGTTTLISNGDSDAFIAKYDPNGNLLWAKSEGGTSGDGAGSISTDNVGNLYFAGSYNSTLIAVGNNTFTNVDPSGGSGDLFLVKYDGNGNIIWSEKEGGTITEQVVNISTDASGNLILLGVFLSPTLTIGSSTLTTDGPAPFTQGTFLAKYNSAGNSIWAQKVGNNGGQMADFVVGSSGELFTCGTFKSPTFTLGGLTFTNASNSGNTYDFFVAGLDPSGNFTWSKSAGGTKIDGCAGIVTSPSGRNIFLSGGFTSPTLALGATTISCLDTSGTFYDFYIARLTIESVTVPEETGINEFSLSENINASPNPFFQHTFLKSPIALENAEVVLSNNLGQIVKMSSITASPEQPFEISREDLPPGIYYLHLLQNMQAIGVKKLIILEK